jgi:hypothetical protein
MKTNNFLNRQRGIAPLVVIAIVAVLAIGGGTYVASKNKAKKAQLEGNIQTQADANANVNPGAGKTKGSLRSLLALGTNTQCTFSNTEEGFSYSGTTYIGADGNMSGDFSSTTSQGTLESHIIYKDGISYAWSGNQGVKMAVDLKSNASASGEANQSFDLDADIDYECKPWTRDEAKFTVPTTVKFTDLTSVDIKAKLPSGVKLPNEN